MTTNKKIDILGITPVKGSIFAKFEQGRMNGKSEIELIPVEMWAHCLIYDNDKEDFYDQEPTTEILPMIVMNEEMELELAIDYSNFIGLRRV